MSYLRLDDQGTDSCDFKVQLSNPFNTKYYNKLRITGRNYGSSTSSVSSYLESRTARSSTTSRYVRGVVNDGMSAGRTYTLYAYAQAKNGTWYKAGEDTITMEKAGEEDLRISEIIQRDDSLIAGEESRFKLYVENQGTAESSDYTVKVYDEDNNRLDLDNEPSLDPGDEASAYLYFTINEPGEHRLKFYISGGESGDRTEYRTYTWEGTLSTAQNFLKMAMDELGYVEGNNNDTKFGEWYGLNFQPWCAMFVSWCAQKAGILNTLVVSHAYTPEGANWFKGERKYELNTGGYNPKEGDVVYFYSEAKERIGHVGIVVAYDKANDKLYTIEGNSSYQVILRNYTNMRNNAYVNGFGLVGGTSYGTIPSGSVPGSNTPIG